MYFKRLEEQITPWDIFYVFKNIIFLFNFLDVYRKIELSRTLHFVMKTWKIQLTNDNNSTA